jgi:hypothetical protein
VLNSYLFGSADNIIYKDKYTYEGNNDIPKNYRNLQP